MFLILQEFSKEFTNEYLLDLLSEPIKVVVKSNNKFYLRLTMSSRGNAIITSGLTDVVEEFNLNEGDICSFKFIDGRKSPFRDEGAWLELIITKLNK